MAKEGKKIKDNMNEAVDKLKGIGEDIRKEITDENGLVMKSAEASMVLLPTEARKNIIESHKSMVKAGQVMADEYLKAVDKLLKKGS